MACSIKQTIIDKLINKNPTFKVRENEVFIPVTNTRDKEQTRIIAQKKVDDVNKAYLSDVFGKPVSINDSYTNGTGINIHIPDILRRAYDVKENRTTYKDFQSEVVTQPKEQPQSLFSQFVRSLNSSNVNPILQQSQPIVIDESEITYTDEEGNLCAKDGIRGNKFTKNSQWEIVKDLKGYPSHSQGGVDIKLGKDGFSFARKDGVIKAAHGLILPAIKAQNGVVVNNDDPPSILDKIKSALNPKNWGVPDYTDKGDRHAAYAAARKAGEKEFMWNNKRFHTRKDTDALNVEIPKNSKQNPNNYTSEMYSNYIQSNYPEFFKLDRKSVV